MAQPPAPAACDLESRPRQWRFFQRAAPAADASEDEHWQVATFAQQGMDEARLRPGLTRLEASPTRQALILMRNGRIVYERYFNGSRRADSNPIASVSKSMLSALVGIAMQQGFIRTAEDRIAEYLPQYFTEMRDPQKLGWTMRDMLTMAHGMQWIEDEAGRLLNRSRDWTADILQLPLNSPPGSAFLYSTGASQLIAALLTEAAGMSLCDFAHRYLFAPIGIDAEFWGVDPVGTFAGGHSVSMTARELARFGTLFLNEGNWQGRQIVPGWWVAASTTPRIEIGDNYAGYGYYWWLNTIAGYDMFSALGAGGQILHVLPQLHIVMVTTHSFRGNRRDFAEEAESYDFLWNSLIPAVTGG